MAEATRFGKKVRVKSNFQLKHRLLLWWLKHRAAKEDSAVPVEADKMRARSVPVHEAT